MSEANTNTHYNDLIALLGSAPIGAEKLYDVLLWSEFHDAVFAAAEFHSSEYLSMRSLILEFHSSQTTFHLAALAKFAGDPKSSSAIQRFVRERLPAATFGPAAAVATRCFGCNTQERRP